MTDSGPDDDPADGSTGGPVDDGDAAGGPPGNTAGTGDVEVVDPASPMRPPGDGEGSVTVVGTAHVSEESVREVEETIERERPDVVAVELDESRYRRLKGGEPDDIDPKDLIRGRTVFQFIAYWLLS